MTSVIERLQLRWKCNIYCAGTLKGDRRLDITEHAAEQSKDGTKAKTETK
jgi:hypothetical protein